MHTPLYRRPDKVLVYLYRRVPPDPPLDAPGKENLQGNRETFEYLLLRRQPETTNAGGIWQTVVGSVRWEEERIEAARREVFEETGLTLLRGITAIGYAFSFPIRLHKDQESWYAPEVSAIKSTVYAGEVVGARPIGLCPEHVAYGWFPFSEALERLHWAEEREALSRLHPLIAADRPDVVLHA